MSGDVSRETRERLDRYAELLLAWNARINLVGTRSRAELERRHIADCLQVAELVRPGASPLLDLGSGAGLPGLIVAICRPTTHVICIDSDQRKAAFLREAIRRLDLNASVRAARIEDVEPLAAPLLTARGLAPLPDLLGHVSRHLAEGGTALLMKGRRWQEELEKARAAWHFSVEAASSRTDPQAVILSIGGLNRA